MRGAGGSAWESTSSSESSADGRLQSGGGSSSAETEALVLGTDTGVPSVASGAHAAGESTEEAEWKPEGVLGSVLAVAGGTGACLDGGVGVGAGAGVGVDPRRGMSLTSM